MSGLMGGSWRRGSPVGHRGSQAGVLEHATIDGLDGTQSAGHLPPRQLPTRHRYAVSKAVFNAVDSLAWRRIMRWIRAKHKCGRNGIGMNELRRRFCDKRWRFAWNGVVFTGASSVAVTRYRYRGSTIPTPWTPKPATATIGG